MMKMDQIAQSEVDQHTRKNVKLMGTIQERVVRKIMKITIAWMKGHLLMNRKLYR